jgi:DNA-binding transcriptional ArsR family regulator
MTLHSNKNYGRDATRPPDPRIALLKELADPIRLRVVDRLGNEGPATVTRLAGELGLPLPQLSNHLRRLRAAGLVSVERTGRQAVYGLADPGLELLTPLLDSITGRVIAAEPPPVSAVPSRTCYAHLGGRIGVAIYRALIERKALVARPDGLVELGPTAGATLGRLGVDPVAIDPGRQRFAFECLDATERAPHLAGALGDALARALGDRGWLEHESGSREYALTPAGRRGLKQTLGIVPASAR